MKRKQNDIKLGDALAELMDTYKLSAKLNQIKVVEAWPKVLGKVIGNHTEKIWVKNAQLFVKLDSAALKNELMYSKSKIIDSLNEFVGAVVVNELVFI
ncbi:MAG: putative nucleic acid-binding Zn ribbon protein [Saprospiraceae bacterium]|jgi:predicted nucleic acid-binding Zn ribbon protein